MSTFLFALLFGLASLATAAEPPTEPTLRIETGMHTAPINRIGADRAGRWLLTASDDKTARLWDLQDGRLAQTYRPPIGPGNEGKLYAGALSPDGRWVAVGGWGGGWDESDYILIFDRASGRLLRRLTGLPQVVKQLVFSPDGTWLAAGLGGKSGLRLWRTGSWERVGEDRDFGGNVYGLDFSADSQRLAATSEDGDLRLYRLAPELHRLARVKAPGGEPTGIRFGPDGRLAVGYYDHTRADVLNADDLSLDVTPDLAGMRDGSLSSVAWSGRRLLAGGTWGDQGSPLRTWPETGHGRPSNWLAGQSTLMDLAQLPEGAVAWGSADPAWGVLDDMGRTRLSLTPASADLRSNREGFRLSAAGHQVRFGYENNGKSPVVFDLAQRRFLPENSAGLASPRTEGLDVRAWKNDKKPTLNGRPLALLPHEKSRSLAIAPDAERFALGTEWRLRLYAGDGRELWQQAAPGVAWAVNIPASNTLVVVAYGDGTIRWHRLSDGRELLALFPHADRKRWVLWTPSGYYAASPGGEDLIGWHVNNGRDAAADLFPASRFRERFNRPDVIDRILSTLDEDQALRQADSARGQRTQQVSIARILPPVVDVLSPDEGSRVSEPRVTLRYRVRSPADAPVTAVRARVNGQSVESGRALKPVKVDDGSQTISIPLPRADAEVQLFAENKNGISVAATLNLVWAGEKEAFTVKPKLYVLAVGVSDYANRDYRLNYAAKDAADFAAALRKQAGRMYREVEVKLLTDTQANKDEVLDGLDWLRQQVGQKDMGMLFLAGHGMNDSSGLYYYLPHNANAERLLRTGVSMGDIRNTLKSLSGKAVFFLDTCHSGNVLGRRSLDSDIAAVLNEMASAENGVVVFSSSSGREYSLEDPKWGNGAFTKALLEGFDGRADVNRSGRITFKMLDFYVSERVKELTRGQQHPVTQAPGGVPDFPLATLR